MEKLGLIHKKYYVIEKVLRYTSWHYLMNQKKIL